MTNSELDNFYLLVNEVILIICGFENVEDMSISHQMDIECMKKGIKTMQVMPYTEILMEEILWYKKLVNVIEKEYELKLKLSLIL